MDVYIIVAAKTHDGETTEATVYTVPNYTYARKCLRQLWEDAHIKESGLDETHCIFDADADRGTIAWENGDCLNYILTQARPVLLRNAGSEIGELPKPNGIK